MWRRLRQLQCLYQVSCLSFIKKIYQLTTLYNVYWQTCLRRLVGYFLRRAERIRHIASVKTVGLHRQSKFKFRNTKQECQPFKCGVLSLISWGLERGYQRFWSNIPLPCSVLMAEAICSSRMLVSIYLQIHAVLKQCKPTPTCICLCVVKCKLLKLFL